MRISSGSGLLFLYSRESSLRFKRRLKPSGDGDIQASARPLGGILRHATLKATIASAKLATATRVEGALGAFALFVALLAMRVARTAAIIAMGVSNTARDAAIAAPRVVVALDAPNAAVWGATLLRLNTRKLDVAIAAYSKAPLAAIVAWYVSAPHAAFAG